MAKPMASPFKATPGPDEEVMPMPPAYEAPMAAQAAAISSSAWKVVTPKGAMPDKVCRTLDAGVIG